MSYVWIFLSPTYDKDIILKYFFCRNFYPKFWFEPKPKKNKFGHFQAEISEGAEISEKTFFSQKGGTCIVLSLTVTISYEIDCWSK